MPKPKTESHPDRASARLRIRGIQLERRNLSPVDRYKLGKGNLADMAEQAKAKQRERGKEGGKKGGRPPKGTEKPLPTDVGKGSTPRAPTVAVQVAQSTGLGRGTVEKLAALDKAGKLTPEVEDKLRAGETSPAAEYKKLRQEKKRDEVRAEKKARVWPEGKYGVILADPPWTYEFTETESRSLDNQYPTMDLDAICSLPIADLSLDDATLFLWATSPKLEEAFRVMRSWGFAYKTCMVWVKDKIGMGYYARQRHELLLIGTRGNPGTPAPADRPDSVVEEKRGKHSEKPARFHEIIEAMYPLDPRVELFSRRDRDGWASWGNEAGS